MLRRSLLLPLLLLAACASDGIQPLKWLEIATSPYVDEVSSSLTGSLMYEGGCLIFRDDASHAHLVPIWPTGSTFNGTAVTFHQPAKAEQRIVVGEEFMMEGRAAEWAQIDSEYYDRFRQQCGSKPFYVSAVRPAN